MLSRIRAPATKCCFQRVLMPICGSKVRYPRGLTAAELSIPTRMMAIADIFEALTAADRPYKPAKTLSESIAILHRMKRKRPIDADLFDLFLRSGVHLRFAHRFLSPEQIDITDITPYLDDLNGRAG